MYWEPSKAVTGKRPARLEKRPSSRNFDDGWMLARSLMDGSTSWYSERNSDRNSSSGSAAGGGDDAAADWYAERVSLVGLESKSSSAVWGGLVDRVPEREDCM